MASNSFGKQFKITTFGESHGKSIGVIVDGCPAGLKIDEEIINRALKLRAPGLNSYVTSRVEPDRAEIISGTFEGKTTGAPMAILIKNHDADSSKYEPIKDILRPGHANFTYLKKYGIFDYRGGGRASARETACRVAAGAIALEFLEQNGVKIFSYLKQMGNICAKDPTPPFEDLEALIYKSPVFCPDEETSLKMCDLIQQAKNKDDSVGGVVEFIAINVPVGLGDPVYDKLEARLGFAMMSLPACKGFEIGEGFQSVLMNGSVHNDLYKLENDRIETETNHAGGILGGISNGMPIFGRVAFKPTSSVMKEQKSLSLSGENTLLKLPKGSRHDPCVAIRAVPVVKAMMAITLMDAWLLNRNSTC